MDRYSGVTIDYYDDRGELLKAHFPTPEDVPDIIKTANVIDRDKLPNEAFALVAVDEGNVLRKFACTDPGTTSMSVMYFMENRDKLPPEAVKTAAANLAVACLNSGLIPPDQLVYDGVEKLGWMGPAALSGLAGAGIGGATGYYTGEPGSDRTGRAVKGALIGGALGTLAGGGAGIARQISRDKQMAEMGAAHAREAGKSVKNIQESMKRSGDIMNQIKAQMQRGAKLDAEAERAMKELEREISKYGAASTEMEKLAAWEKTKKVLEYLTPNRMKMNKALSQVTQAAPTVAKETTKAAPKAVKETAKATKEVTKAAPEAAKATEQAAEKAPGLLQKLWAGARGASAEGIQGAAHNFFQGMNPVEAARHMNAAQLAEAVKAPGLSVGERMAMLWNWGNPRTMYGRAVGSLVTAPIEHAGMDLANVVLREGGRLYAPVAQAASGAGKNLATGALVGGAAGGLGGATQGDISGGVLRGAGLGMLGGMGGRAFGPGLMPTALGAGLAGGAGGALIGRNKTASVKEAYLRYALPAAGAALGAGTGAMVAGEGNRLKGALLGGALGAAGGFGGGLIGSNLGLAGGAALGGRGLAAAQKAGATGKALEQAGERAWGMAGIGEKAGLGLGAAGGALGMGAAGGKLIRSKPATPMPKEASMVDITGQLPTPIIKVASPESDEDWAVIMPDGARHYPIQTWDQIKTAEGYFMDNKHQMEPSIRRQFAVKLAAKACQVGYPAKEEVKETGAKTKKAAGMMKSALEMRKLVGGDPEFLDELFEKQASLDPNVYAEVLNRFDCDTGLDRFWDNRIFDPWASTFGVVKTAERVIFEDGGERLTEGQLQNLVTNRLNLLTEQFTDDVAKEFSQDPIGIFNSMPLPQQRLIARMAADASSDGSSEGTEKLSAWAW